MREAQNSQSSAVRQAAPKQIQILVPIYNEGENVCRLHQELRRSGASYDSLCFVYDFEGDTTLPYIAQLTSTDNRVHADMNRYGKGVLNALRWGFAHAGGGAVIVVMGDNSDKLELIPEMVELWRQGATIVSPSRYMRGGEQHGGGLVKSTMSRVAGTSLKLLGFPTADPTNNFKLYDGEWLSSQQIESSGGFELAMELSYKAYRDRRRIVELPTVWRDRTEGTSRFKLFAWTPKYLRWYFKIVGELLLRKFKSESKAGSKAKP